jgi:uroporphyrinogen III methyltransferase / synthase
MSSLINAQRPLLNRTVLVACSENKAPELAAGLEALGAIVVHLPVIELREIEDKGLLDQALISLGQYSWLIFTSAYAVRFFIKRMIELGVSGNSEAIPKICAIGPATAKAVRDSCLDVALVPEKFVAEGIVEALGSYFGGPSSLEGQRILLPRALEAREVLPDALNAAGAKVDVIPCYWNAQGKIENHRIRQLRTSPPDIIVFTSSSTVRNLIDILGPEDGKSMLRKSIVAVLGPITRDTVESYGKSAEIVPKESAIPSLLEEIGLYCSENYSKDS